METTSIAGKWVEHYASLKAIAIRASKEMFQKKINQNEIPVTEKPGQHLSMGEAIFRGKAKTERLHPAMPGILHREDEERGPYVWYREDDPIGYRFDEYGRKWGFMNHPSPPSYHVNQMLCDTTRNDGQKIRGLPPVLNEETGSRVRKRGGGTNKAVGPEPQAWQQEYVMWWGNNPTVLFDCRNRITLMEPMTLQAVKRLAGFDDNLYSKEYEMKCYEYRTKAMDAVCR